MGAVLVGKGPSDKHAETSDMFFNAIKELVDSAGKEQFVTTQKRIRTTFMSHIDKTDSLQVLTFLSFAIDNYLQQTHEHIAEKLGDNTYEYNDCSVCEWAGTDYFYYSTIYGLNKPVCKLCVEEKEFGTAKDDEDDEKEEEDEDEDEDEDEKEDEDEDDEDEDDEDEDEDEDDEDEDEEDELCDHSQYQEKQNDDREKFFGCEGCQYEWRDGWQKGWKTAMKQVKNFAKQQKRSENIHIPECASCGASHNLKKCGGTCEGTVLYCSTVCQQKDWKEGHRQDCFNK
jgi:hypothetical protein